MNAITIFVTQTGCKVDCDQWRPVFCVWRFPVSGNKSSSSLNCNLFHFVDHWVASLKIIVPKWKNLYIFILTERKVA